MTAALSYWHLTILDLGHLPIFKIFTVILTVDIVKSTHKSNFDVCAAEIHLNILITHSLGSAAFT